MTDKQKQTIHQRTFWNIYSRNCDIWSLLQVQNGKKYKSLIIIMANFLSLLLLWFVWRRTCLQNLLMKLVRCLYRSLWLRYYLVLNDDISFIIMYVFCKVWNMTHVKLSSILRLHPSNTWRSPNVGLMLGHRLLYWTNIKPTLGGRDVFACHILIISQWRRFDWPGIIYERVSN